MIEQILRDLEINWKDYYEGWKGRIPTEEFAFKTGFISAIHQVYFELVKEKEHDSDNIDIF